MLLALHISKERCYCEIGRNSHWSPKYNVFSVTFKKGSKGVLQGILLDSQEKALNVKNGILAIVEEHSFFFACFSFPMENVLDFKLQSLKMSKPPSQHIT